MRLSITRSLYFALASVMLLLASCAKEECVSPASSQPAGEAKNVVMDPGTNELGKAGMKDASDDQQDGGSGISDDGDDLSDSERSKKKKPTN